MTKTIFLAFLEDAGIAHCCATGGPPLSRVFSSLRGPFRMTLSKVRHLLTRGAKWIQSDELLNRSRPFLLGKPGKKRLVSV